MSKPKITFVGWELPAKNWKGNLKIPKDTVHMASYEVLYNKKHTGAFFDVYVTKKGKVILR